MKKFLTLILAISLLLSMTLLSGCISEDMQTEIEEGIKNEVEEAIQEEIDAIEESIQGEVDDFLNRDPETEQEPTEDASKEIPGVSADDPFGVEVSKKYVWGYKKLLKHKWTPILTSFYDNETLVIYQRHSRWGHLTYYMVALFEGDTCTYYYGDKGANHMDVGQKPKDCTYYGTFQNASGIHPGLKNIYACTEQVLVYQTLVAGERINGQFYDVETEASELKKAAASAGLVSAIDAVIGDKSFFGKAVDVKDYIVKAYNITSSTKEDIIKENEDKNFTEIDVDAVAQNVTGLTSIVHNSQEMMESLDAKTPNISLTVGTKPDLWTNLISFEELGATVENTDFRVSETCLQWKYKDSDTWNDLKDLKEITPDGKNVVFQITNTHVQWRVLTLTEQMLAEAQANLHAAVKRDGKPALKQ